MINRLTASVALATYNGGKYIEQQLLSIADQTCLPMELVVSDDRSTDDTLQIIRDFAKSAPFPVKIFSNPVNIGYAQNFGVALSRCSGDVVFLSDQDDFWLPEKIEIILGRMEQEPGIQLFIHDLEFCKEDLTPIGETKVGRIRKFGDVDHDYVVGMATAVRRNFLKHCLPIPSMPQISHDLWLHICASAIGRRRIMPEVLALYRRHSGTFTIGNPINSDSPTSRSGVIRARLSRSLDTIRKLTATPQVNDPRAALKEQWLVDKKTMLLAEGYVSADTVNKEIAALIERRRALLEREKIWQLPRWRRITAIGTLLKSGAYRRLFRWRSAMKDMFVSRP